MSEEVVEDGKSYEENAYKKAKAFESLPFPVFSDDSGLEITALGGAPGVFSARFSEPFTDVELLGDRQAVLTFAPEVGTLTVAVGLSAVSAENARENRLSEVPELDFDAVHARAEALWRDALSDIVVEEYVPGGAEYSVESLSYHGEHRIVQVTEKWSSGAPHCVELGHHQPARLDSRMRARVEDVISRALTAVGVDNGCCHTEIKICDGDIYLIEFNARPGGDHIAYPLTELSTGYPYITGIIETAFDVDVLPDPASLGAAWAGICFVTEQTSALKPVFDTCRNQPWCYEKHQVTEELRPLTHNRGYDTNYFIYRAEDARPEFLDVWGAGVTG